MTLPNLARYRISADVLPQVTEALFIGEHFHRLMVARLQDPVFSGQVGDRPAEGHQHAWYLPEINQYREIEHILIYAAAGFSPQAIASLGSLTRTRTAQRQTLRTSLVTLGHLNDLRTASPLLGPSRRWRSLTPFVLPRFAKFDRQRNPRRIAGTPFQVEGPEDQALYLVRQLRRSLHGDTSLEGCTKARFIADDGKGDWLALVSPTGQLPLMARQLSDTDGKHAAGYPWQAFRRSRQYGKGRQSCDRGHWIEIEFAEPQPGPIALGYGAHFGLGLMVPVLKQG